MWLCLKLPPAVIKFFILVGSRVFVLRSSLELTKSLGSGKNIAMFPDKIERWVSPVVKVIGLMTGGAVVDFK